jgi:hypothetical protein
MGTEDASEMDPILNYQDWDTQQDIRQISQMALADGTLKMKVGQEVALRFPFHRTFYAADFVEMTGESYLDNHYTLYLDDQGW